MGYVQRDRSDALEWARICDGKEGHSKHSAEQKAESLNRRGRGVNCKAYECRFCRKWHVGHRRPE